MCYDQSADMTLKREGNRLFERLKDLSGEEGFGDHHFAEDVCLKAFGVLPIGDGPNKLSDDETRALIPVVRAARASLEITVALLARRQR